MILTAALWLCATTLARDTRRPLTPPLRLVRIDLALPRLARST